MTLVDDLREARLEVEANSLVLAGTARSAGASEARRAVEDFDWEGRD